MKAVLVSTVSFLAMSSAMATTNLTLNNNQSVKISDGNATTIVTCIATSTKPACSVVKTDIGYFAATVGGKIVGDIRYNLDGALNDVQALKKASICE